MAHHPSTKAEAVKSGYFLRLYIAGATTRSRRAIANIKQVCDQYLDGDYSLEVTDIYQNSETLARDNVVAAPTLIKKNPPPVRRFIGDLSDRERVIAGLALKKKIA